MRPRFGFFLFVVTAIGLSAITLVLVRYAQGYRLVFDGGSLFKKGTVTVASTGLLVATSTPDGASVYIDGHLTSATNSTLDLAPNEYTVKIVKEGYLPWEKKLKIQKEVVTQTQALLFPAAPKLESITASGALKPVADPTGSSIAFGVASASASRRNGVYVLDMGTRPILTLRNSSLQIADDSIDALSGGQFSWSPSGRELLVTVAKSKATYRLRSGEFNSAPQNITATLAFTKTQWEREKAEEDRARLEGLKPALSEFISKYMKVIAWSNDGTKVLYEASVSANGSSKLALFIDPPLVGTNSQPEEREVKERRLYVYDTKEDKNFFIKEIDSNLSLPVWFPDNRHLVFIEEKQVKIMEYDGINRTAVYSGPLEGNFVYPWPDGSKLVILTSLNPQAGVAPNLYTINLK